MFTVVITEKTGGQKRLSFGEPEVTIGRVPGNDVVLPKGNVSKRHSRIVLKDNRFIVVDLKSTNGTYVNGRKITSPLVVKEGDKIYIGDFVLTLEGDLSASGSVRPPIPRTELDLSERAPASGSSAVPPLPSRAPEPMAADDSLPVVLRGNGPSLPPPALSSHTSAPPPIPNAAGPRGMPSIPPVIGGLDTVSERPPESLDSIPSPPPEGAHADASVPPLSAHAPEGALRPRSAMASAPISSRPRHTPPPARLAMAPGPLTLAGQSDLRLLMVRLSREFDLEDADPNAAADERRWQKAERSIQSKLSELASENPTRFRDRAGLARAALHEAVGLGPLDNLLADASVFQVLVERADRVRADRGQGLTLEPLSFSSPQAVLTVVRRLSAQAGLTGTLPDSLELTLPNGLHVVAVLKSAASEGPVLAVQRRPLQGKGLLELAPTGLLSEAQAGAIQEAVHAKRHIWFVGPAGAELAKLFAATLAACPGDERSALFERAPEIAIGERSTICLRLGSVPIETLLERVRHFRPDRLAIHEPREAELAVILGKLAMQHGGSLVSFEHKSGKDALIAFERAVGADVVLRAVSLVVELKRGAQGVTVSGIFEPSIDGSGLLTLAG